MTHAQTIAVRLRVAPLPAGVKAGLIRLLEECGPKALAIGIDTLEAAFPGYEVPLELVKAALAGLIPPPPAARP